MLTVYQILAQKEKYRAKGERDEEKERLRVGDNI